MPQNLFQAFMTSYRTPLRLTVLEGYRLERVTVQRQCHRGDVLALVETICFPRGTG
jgi:hypothetical protein